MLFDKWLWYSRLKRLTKSFSSFVNMLTFFSISIPSFIDVCSCTTFLHISTKDNTCKYTYSICKLISFNIIKSKKLTLSRFPSLLLFVCHVVFSRFMPSKRFRGISRNTHFWTVIQFQLPTAVFCYELETCFSAAILPSVNRSGWNLARSVVARIHFPVQFLSVRCTGRSRPNQNDFVYSPRDAMRKRGLCCPPVSVRPSVRHVRVLYPDGWRYRQTSLSAH